jgi:hypothetical protein
MDQLVPSVQFCEVLIVVKQIRRAILHRERIERPR